MRILLIEDHPIVRDACRLLLQDRPDFIVLEASTGAEGERLCATESPDVVVLDLNLPDCGGLDVLRRLRAADPARRVIVFSMYENPSLVARAMDAGARGYVTKSDDPDALLEAISQVAAGGSYLSVVAARQVALWSLRREPESLLSAREREVLELLAEGCSIGRIAERLGTSYRTAASAVAQLRTKLDLPSNAALIRRAVELARR
jgi:two-component system, NarL family, invasion response regulator UvrY